MPIYTSVMHPLFGLKIHHGTSQVVTHEAVREVQLRYRGLWDSAQPLHLSGVDHIEASTAVPWILVVDVLLEQISAVAARMHHNLAHLTD